MVGDGDVENRSERGREGIDSMLREWKRDVRGFGSSEVLISRQHGRGWEIRLGLNADQVSSIGLSFGLAWNALAATQFDAAR